MSLKLCDIMLVFIIKTIPLCLSYVVKISLEAICSSNCFRYESFIYRFHPQ